MHKIYFLIVFCLLATISNQASADCTNPAKSEGFIIYNKDHKVAQFCNGTDWIGMAGGTTSIMTGDTMFDGWPDAIQCNVSNPAIGITIFHAMHMPYQDGRYFYRNVTTTSGTIYDIIFNPDSSFNGYQTIVASDCSKPIAQLYTDGQAFNFVGAQPVTTDTLSGLSCTDGQVAVWDNGGSAWVCATSAGSDTLAALSCTDGQMVLYDTASTAWICADVSASGAADNLGDHTATQNLDMASYGIDNVESITLDSVTGGAAPQVGGSDNLGDHTATENIILGANYLSGDGGNEGIIIDANGNVGIGISSPNAPLEVTTSSGTTEALIARFSASNGRRLDLLQPEVGNVSDPFTWVTANAFQWRVDSVDALMIDSGGKVGIGTTSPAARLDVNGSIAAGPMGPNGSSTNTTAGSHISATGYGWFARAGGGTLYLQALSGSSSLATFLSGASTVGTITTNGSSTAYNTTSDYRLKENVAVIDGALDRVSQLKPSRFSFKLDDKHEMVDGFIAHEVQEIAPYAVTGEKDSVDENGKPLYQQVDYGKLTPLLTAAIQELKAENDELRAELDEVKAAIAK
jgi:hypothetical protein